MTSKPRIIVPNHFYHVYSKGVFGVNIFQDNVLKEFFLKELSTSLQKFSFKCFAWTVMNDHYHLVLKSNTNSLSLFMQRLNSTYAKEYNKRNNRNGPVFAKRFSSIVVQDGEYLNEIIRHIHLNPVRNGICNIENLDSYFWSGHRALVNNISDNIINIRDVLDLFCDSDLDYKKIICSTCQNSHIINLTRASDKGSLDFHNSNCFVIGDNIFTQKVFELDRIQKARIAKYAKENLTLDGMLEKVGTGVLFGSQRDILRQGRLNERSTARQLFATIGHCDYEFPCTDIAKYLKITTSAVSTMISRSKRITELHILKEMICDSQIQT